MAIGGPLPTGQQLRQGLIEAAPLFAAMSAGYSSGRGPFAYLDQGIATMAMAREKRDKEAQEQQQRQRAQQALQGIIGGPMVGRQMGGGMRSPNAQIGADAMEAIGGLPASLIGTESGGNWKAQNAAMGAGGMAGHFGRGQFGQARLQEAMAAGAIPAGMTPQQFMADPQAQIAVERWHVSDINNYIKERGLDRYVGQTVGGVQVTPQGMLAAAHLGGKRGLERFLETGGQYNPADVNGTSLADYMRTHGQAAGGGMEAQPQQAQAQFDPFSDPIVARLAEVRMMPGLTPDEKSIVDMRMQARIQAIAPQGGGEGFTLSAGQVRFGPDGQPIASAPGGATVDRVTYGVTPQPIVRKDGSIGIGVLGSDGTFKEVELPGGAEIARGIEKVDAGTKWILLDKFGNVVGEQPKNIEAAEVEKARGAVTGRVQGEAAAGAPGEIVMAQETLGFVDELRSHPGLKVGTGFTSLANAVPGTPGYDLANRVAQVKSGAFLTAIDQLRGLGSLSNAEGQTATAAITRLDTATSTKEFLEALADYERIVKIGLERAKSRLPNAGGQPAQPPVGGGNVLTFDENGNLIQ